MDLETRDERLNQMILEGEALEAFEKYYADDVFMQDGPDMSWKGKDTNREREEDFFSKITELRKVEVKKSAVNPGEGVSFSVWHFDYSHEEWGDVKYDQVAVRTWNDEGRIESERFFKMD